MSADGGNRESGHRPTVSAAADEGHDLDRIAGLQHGARVFGAGNHPPIHFGGEIARIKLRRGEQVCERCSREQFPRLAIHRHGNHGPNSEAETKRAGR